MLLDRRDIELLRLIGLCKDIPADCSPLQSDMFSQTEFAVLTGAGYIQKAKRKLSYRLTDKGFTLLKSLGYTAEKDKHPVGNNGVLKRRLDVAKVILTFYRAGISVFGEIQNGCMFTPAFTFRRNTKGGILGASRMCGVLCLEKQSVAVYFVSGSIKLNAKMEKNTLERLSIALQSPKRYAALFLGDNTNVLESFISPFGDSKDDFLWGDDFAVRQHLLPYELEPTPLEVSIYT